MSLINPANYNKLIYKYIRKFALLALRLHIFKPGNKEPPFLTTPEVRIVGNNADLFFFLDFCSII
jgi:hypothetical protein